MLDNTVENIALANPTPGRKSTDGTGLLLEACFCENLIGQCTVWAKLFEGERKEVGGEGSKGWGGRGEGNEVIQRQLGQGAAAPSLMQVYAVLEYDWPTGSHVRRR